MKRSEMQSGEPTCWPDDRAEELKILRRLLATVSGLNAGSGFLESVHRCIELADQLRYTDIALRLSFLEHLEQDCIAEREANVPVTRGGTPSAEAGCSASEFTYASKQSTSCAVCGERKHTPLRNDAMGGYVCLTCIDRELIRLQSQNDQADAPEKAHRTVTPPS